MRFYGLNISEIKSNSEETSEYYIYKLGTNIEVTSMKSSHENLILSNILSSYKKEDRLMVRYYPSNLVYFDKDIIDGGELNTKTLSYKIELSDKRIVIGAYEKYELKNGVLAFSARLSANNMIEHKRFIHYNSQFNSSILKGRVKVLSVGILGTDLYGLMYIPEVRGLAISRDDASMGICYSAKTGEPQQLQDWESITLDEWFSKCRIKEYDYN